MLDMLGIFGMSEAATAVFDGIMNGEESNAAAAVAAADVDEKGGVSGVDNDETHGFDSSLANMSLMKNDDAFLMQIGDDLLSCLFDIATVLHPLCPHSNRLQPAHSLCSLMLDFLFNKQEPDV
jgi:hypothetical protein